MKLYAYNSAFNLVFNFMLQHSRCVLFVVGAFLLNGRSCIGLAYR